MQASEFIENVRSYPALVQRFINKSDSPEMLSETFDRLETSSVKASKVEKAEICFWVLTLVTAALIVATTLGLLILDREVYWDYTINGKSEYKTYGQLLSENDVMIQRLLHGIQYDEFKSYRETYDYRLAFLCVFSAVAIGAILSYVWRRRLMKGVESFQPLLEMVSRLKYRLQVERFGKSPYTADYEMIVSSMQRNELEAAERAVETLLCKFSAEIEELESSHATTSRCDEARNRFHDEYGRFSDLGLVRRKKRQFFSGKARA